jgi:hypothetical protein
MKSCLPGVSGDNSVHGWFIHWHQVFRKVLTGDPLPASCSQDSSPQNSLSHRSQLHLTLNWSGLYQGCPWLSGEHLTWGFAGPKGPYPGCSIPPQGPFVPTWHTHTECSKSLAWAGLGVRGSSLNIWKVSPSSLMHTADNTACSLGKCIPGHAWHP